MSPKSALHLAVGQSKENRKDSPEALAAVIERLLRKSPVERYQTCSEVADDLRAVLKTSAPITTVGGHRQFKHPTKSGPTKSGRVTVSGHSSDDVHPKTLKSILTQAGLNK